ncbi:30S ribosomal protein S6 [Candidatus Peribacteria bacterium RIFCSPHIGHO2_01_FULL_55_13]|nr:MAG: 30S ribosomal protein S6 [Candidatus Peribacteria bacterium RIFCSPHIGHO2_01_FULL_55_13]OGJ65707.1 MAG: 30S ribosomal protein S6 [Candidatus Peribacteria bacterium RIFCSPHIGHO2_12_FULL_55_11]
MNPAATDTPEVLDEADVRIYEVAVLLPYPMAQKEEHQTIKEIEAIFKEAGAREVSKDVWGQRGLAYEIKGSSEGNFIVYHQEMDPGKIREIDTALRIVPGVLRHIIVKPPKGYKITKYSETYKVWLKERESASEKSKREREEDIQKRIADKAKRQVKREKTAKAEAPVEAVDKEELGKKLDKLISDDSIEI